MPSVIITGVTGSIGSALVEIFSQDGWEVIGWDCRNGDPPRTPADALVVAQGGNGNNTQEVYEKNTLSVGRVLYIAPRLVKEGGAIIVLTSRRAVRPTLDEWDYAAAKAAAHAYTRALYRAYPSLRITAIACGWVASKMAVEGNAKSVIAVEQLGNMIRLLVECTTMRVPEIVIEPIGDAEY